MKRRFRAGFPGILKIMGLLNLPARPRNFRHHLRGVGILPQWGLVVVLGLTFLACGVKTDPYPEAATLPAKVRDLTQALTDQGELVLSWKPPAENMVGRQLQEIGGFEIQMADYLADEYYCEGCPHQYERVDRIPAAAAPPGLLLAPGPYTWRYKVKSGHVYRFRVYAVGTSGGIHPQAVAETTVWAVGSPGQISFSASLGDKAVDLSWSRPGRGYTAEIEKRSAENGEFKPIKGLNPADGRFSDFEVAYEKTYTYRARLIRLKEDTSAQGAWSAERTVRVVDITPPPAPGFVDAALATGGVRVNWESVAFDPDLAGYRVYRQLEGESGFTRIGPALIKDNNYFDPVRLSPGAVVRYQVTSVDKSPRANESLASPVVDVYLDPPVEAEPRPE